MVSQLGTAKWPDPVGFHPEPNAMGLGWVFSQMGSGFPN